MELVLRPKPRTTSHRILGTSHVSNELDIPNETDIPMSPLPHHRHTYTSHVLGSPVSSRHDHRTAPTVAWPKTCPKRGRRPKHTGYQDSRGHLITVTATCSLPTLVHARKRSPPVYR